MLFAEKVLERFLLLAVDVGELMFAGAAFQGYGDVEGAGGGYGATDSGEDYQTDAVEGDVGCGFGDEYEGFVEREEVAFVGFY